MAKQEVIDTKKRVIVVATKSSTFLKEGKEYLVGAKNAEKLIEEGKAIYPTSKKK